jgi:hypothetical protein
MRWCSTFFASIAFLALLVAAPALAQAQQPGPRLPCVRFVGEIKGAFAVTLQPGCDLREAASLFPQLDPETHSPLPMQEQLRSIYETNEAHIADSKLKARTVSRGCVPTGKAPSFASPEEREICPRGLVNYFGVASQGNQAVILIPKTRMPSHAEQLEVVASSACRALAASGPIKSDSASSSQAKEALSGCRTVVADLPVAAPIPPSAPSEEPSADRVKAMTLDLETKQKRIEQLERTATSAWTARPSEQRTPWAMLVVVAVALLGGTFTSVWFKRRNASRAALQTKSPIAGSFEPGRVMVDKETLARALADIERGFRTKFDQERARFQQETDRQRQTIEDLERQLRDGFEMHARELMQEQPRKRANRDREKELQAELVRVQERHLLEARDRDAQLARMQQENLDALRARDELIEALQKDRQAIDEQSAALEEGRLAFEKQMANLKSDVLRQNKRIASLTHRLSSARGKPDSVSIPPTSRRIAGAGGLPAQTVGNRLVGAASC